MNKEDHNAYHRAYTRNKRKDTEYRKQEYQQRRQWWKNIKAQVLAMREERAQQQ